MRPAYGPAQTGTAPRMALTNSSTIENALAQYNDNLLYEASPTKAANLLEAVRYLIANRGKALSAAGRSINWDHMEALEERLAPIVAAQQGSATRTSFTRGRPL